jgi:hypothetical protein
MPFHCITHSDAVVGIPESKGVEKSFRVPVHELQCPMRATIRRFVNP